MLTITMVERQSHTSRVNLLIYIGLSGAILKVTLEINYIVCYEI